jgi:hypothetical protein
MSTWLLIANIFFSPLSYLKYGRQVKSFTVHSIRIAQMWNRHAGNLRGNMRRTKLMVLEKNLSGWNDDELDRVYYR